MTFPKGQWTTEYAVRFDWKDTVTNYRPAPTEDVAVAWARRINDSSHNGKVVAQAVSRQVFHGEWQPLPERTDT